MSDLLKSYRFREEREADWRKLDLILTRAENSGVKALTDEEMTALPRLYRQAVSSLSVARSISLDQNVTAYLESLCTRAYFFVYGARTSIGERNVLLEGAVRHVKCVRDGAEASTQVAGIPKEAAFRE